MSKYSWIFVIVFVLMFTTIMVDLVATTNASIEVAVDFTDVEGYSRTNVFSLIGTFFRIIGFRVTGLPLAVNVVLNLLLYYPLSAILMYLVIEVLKDLVPLT